MPKPLPLLILALLGVGLPGSLKAQLVVPPANGISLRVESTQAQRRLDEIRRKIPSQSWSEILEAYQQLQDEAGDALIWTNAETLRRVREVCQSDLVKLPDAARRLIRDRIEPEAQRQLQAARQARSIDGLSRIIENRFLSRACEQAILLRADLDLELGDFERADATLAYLDRLFPNEAADSHPAPSHPESLRYPDPQTELALVRARRAWIAWQRGDAATARRLLKSIQTHAPTASGLVAGRSGKLAESLQSAFSVPAPQSTPFVVQPWQTFAGDNQHSGIGRGPLPRFWRTSPTWTRRIPQPIDDVASRNRDDADDFSPTHLPVRAPQRYPVLSQDAMWFQDGQSIHRMDVLTGQSVIVHQNRAILGDADAVSDGDIPKPPPGYVLAMGRSALIARVGPIAVAETGNLPLPQRPAVLIALATKPDREGKFRKLWELPPPRAENTATEWEGVPLIEGERFWTLLRRREGGRTLLLLRAYLGINREIAPDLLWEREVLEITFDSGDSNTTQPYLLTSDARQIIVGPIQGWILSFDAVTGTSQWATRASRTDVGRFGQARPSLPNPVRIHSGRVIAAIPESGQILALDRVTGRRLWETDPKEIHSIVGVSDHQVIVSLQGEMRGLQAIDAQTGSTDGPNGWVIHDPATPYPSGQGLLLGDSILWPTRSGLMVLDRRSGELLRQPIPIPPGNLAYSDGCLVVTAMHQIFAWVPESRLAKLPDQAVNADPESSLRWLALLDSAPSLPGDPPKLAEPRRIWEIAVRQEAIRQIEQSNWTAVDRLLQAVPDPVAGWRRHQIATTQHPNDSELAKIFQMHERQLDRITPILTSRNRVRSLGNESSSTPTATDSQVLLQAWQQPMPQAGTIARTWLTQFGMPTERTAAPLEVAIAHAILRREAIQNGELEREVFHEAELRAGFGDQVLPALDAQLTVNRWLEQSRSAKGNRPANVDSPIPDWELCGANVPIRDGWPLLPFAGRPERSADALRWAKPMAVMRREFPTGRTIWETPLGFQPTHGTRWGNSVLVAGAGGLARVADDTGALIWAIGLPNDWAMFSSRSRLMPCWVPDTDSRLIPGWHDFRMLNGFIIAVWDAHVLVVIDSETGWIRWSDAGWNRWIGCENQVFLVRGDQFQERNLATGRMVRSWKRNDRATAIERMPSTVTQPFGWIEAFPDGQIVAWDSQTGQSRWTVQLPGASSLSGQPIRLQARGDWLLVQSERNMNWELDLLRIDTGKRVWGHSPIGIRNDPNHPPRIILTAAMVLVWNEQMLVAYDANTGALRWRRGGAELGVGSTVDFIEDSDTIALVDAGRENRLGSMLGIRFPKLAPIVYDEETQSEQTMVQLMLRDGEPIRRWTLPAIWSMGNRISGSWLWQPTWDGQQRIWRSVRNTNHRGQLGE
ncbi:outer membrane protein assembly factor BamB family protein [Tuwongella immobilis]|nr:PQQ-binding-like beta-propeller repeat protein [Tuwongella immobilis]